MGINSNSPAVFQGSIIAVKTGWGMFPDFSDLKESQISYWVLLQQHKNKWRKPITLRPFNRGDVFQTHQKGTYRCFQK